jgi:hypothetical protein
MAEPTIGAFERARRNHQLMLNAGEMRVVAGWFRPSAGRVVRQWGTALSCAEGSTCPQWAQPGGRPRLMSSPVLKWIVSWRGSRGSGTKGDGTYRAYEEASARVQDSSAEAPGSPSWGDWRTKVIL